MKPKSFQEKDGKWFHREITARAIGAALEVHRTLGPGFLEYVYQEALCYELKLRKIPFIAQKELDIWYKDLLLQKRYTPDFIIEDNVIIEIKASSGLTENDEAQLLNYLKATRKRVGLLFNFGKKSLEMKRRVL